MLAENAKRPKRERLTAFWIYEDLRNLGYDGGYDAIRRYASQWKRASEVAAAGAYVSLSFDPGEAYQFDWSHETVLIDGVTTAVKVAHVRLSYSRMPFVRAYPRETPPLGDASIACRAAGDGVRRPRQGVRLLWRSVRAWDLRQYEDGGGYDLRRQGSRL